MLIYYVYTAILWTNRWSFECSNPEIIPEIAWIIFQLFFKIFKGLILRIFIFRILILNKSKENNFISWIGFIYTLVYYNLIYEQNTFLSTLCSWIFIVRIIKYV